MKRGGGGISERDENKRRKVDGEDAIKNKKKMQKNKQRLGGGGGLSLESFANAKTRSDKYNPALIKKQREFYRNAKYVNKYKRSIKQLEQQKVHSTADTQLEGEDEMKNDNGHTKQRNKKNKKNARSLEELYEKQHEEEEKARMEREAMIQATKEQRRQAEARRRTLKEKMYKKTKSGQPVMKYRIEHLLETISGSTN